MLSVLYAIDIWKNNIFPTLFPFLIISHIICEYGYELILKEFFLKISKIFKASKYSSYVFAVSLISPPPTSAIYIKNLYIENKISKDEANKMLTFTYFASPIFILGTVSITFLNCTEIGLKILFIHIISNIIVGFIFRNYKRTSFNDNFNSNCFKEFIKYQKDKKIIKIITTSIKKSLDTILLVLGSITFIYIISNIITPFIHNDLLKAIINGILEVTNGIKSVSLLNISLKYKGLLSIMMLSFGGISIHIQIISILEDTDISYFPFLLARIIHSIISGIIFYLTT